MPSTPLNETVPPVCTACKILLADYEVVAECWSLLDQAEVPENEREPVPVAETLRAWRHFAAYVRLISQAIEEPLAPVSGQVLASAQLLTRKTVFDLGFRISRMGQALEMFRSRVLQQRGLLVK